MSLFDQEYTRFLRNKTDGLVAKPWTALGYLLSAFFIFSLFLLLFVPWIQTSYGTGNVLALYPKDRIQTINALVSGRIAHWHVRDGDVVKKGDPIVEIIDNDPNYVERLTTKRDAIKNRLAALQRTARTSEFNLTRQKSLYQLGLSAKRDYEKAQIEFETYQAKVESVKAELTKYEIDLTRQHSQVIFAPQDGTILSVIANDISSFVKTGDPLVTFLTDNTEMAVELYVRGLDGPFVFPGRRVQLVFEGWPAIQFRGWPAVSKGTFEGEVFFVDPVLSSNGKIRILVTCPEEATTPWPAAYFLRQGTRVKGWILLEKVTLGYELWRQMNGFPLEFPSYRDPTYMDEGSRQMN